LRNSCYTTEITGRILNVWFTTEISEDGHHSVGHTKGYVKTLVTLDGTLPGKTRLVKITSVKKFHIEGEILEGQVCADDTRKNAVGFVGEFLSKNIVALSAAVVIITISGFLLTRSSLRKY
jgi:hypothetical protein